MPLVQHPAHGGDGGTLDGSRLSPPAVRQWVLSVPKRLRYFMQRDGAVLNMVLRIFLRVIAQTLQTHSPGAANVDKATLRRRILRAFVGGGLLESCDAKEMLGYLRGVPPAVTSGKYLVTLGLSHCLQKSPPHADHRCGMTLVMRRWIRSAANRMLVKRDGGGSWLLLLQVILSKRGLDPLVRND